MKKLKSGAMCGILFFTVLVLLLLSGLFPLKKLDLLVTTLFASILLEAIVFVFPSIIFIRLKGTGYSSGLLFSGFSIRKLPLLLSLLSTALFGQILFNAFSYIIGIGGADFTSSSSYILSDIPTSTSFIYVFTAFALVPALAEELLFRGIFFKEYSKYGAIPALVVPSLLYAMSHFDLASFSSHFLMGFVLSYAVLLTNSIWSAIIMHFLANLMNVYFMPALWNVITQPMGILFAIFISVAFFLFFLVLSLWLSEKHYTLLAENSPSGENPKSGSDKLARLIISPFILPSVILYLVASLIILFT